MTPGEVKGLQQLAEAHGGSLTINPHTGLPEAGFLSNLLPTIIGVGAGIATGNPFIGAAVAGGLGYAQNGSLMGGISAGLGAWGGMNLFNGLAAAGATPATSAGTLGNFAGAPVSSVAPQGVNAFLDPSTVGVAGEGANVATEASTLATQAPNAVANGAYPNFAGNAVTGATQVADASTQALTQGANASVDGAALAAQKQAELAQLTNPAYTGSPTSAADYLKYQKSLGMDSMGNLSNTFSNAGQGISNLLSDPSKLGAFGKDNMGTLIGAGMGVLGAIPKPTLGTTQPGQPDQYDLRLAKYKLDPNFKGSFPTQPTPPYKEQYTNYVINPYSPYGAAGGEVQSYAGGGIADLASGGQMAPQQANVDFMGGDMYPQSQQQRSFYATPTQMPTSAQQAMASYEPNTNPLTGQPTVGMAAGGIASYSGTTGSQVQELSPSQVEALAGIYHDSDPNTRDLDPLSAAKYRVDKLGKRFGMTALPDQQLNVRGLGDVAPHEFAAGGSTGYTLGSYAAGGNPRLLKGPGDGMSDNIPAVIGDKQPARLADGEFVVPADVVSHLGNGSTDAGAKHLYNMMDRVRKARTGNKQQGKQINPAKFMPK